MDLPISNYMYEIPPFVAVDDLYHSLIDVFDHITSITGYKSSINDETYQFYENNGIILEFSIETIDDTNIIFFSIYRSCLKFVNFFPEKDQIPLINSFLEYFCNKYSSEHRVDINLESTDDEIIEELSDNDDSDSDQKVIDELELRVKFMDYMMDQLNIK